MNIHTLHVECVLLMLVYTTITMVNSSLYRGMKGNHWFSLYSFFSLISAFAVALRGHIPDMLSIVGGNVAFVIAYLALFLSLYTLWGGKRFHLWIQIVLITLAVVTMIQWGIVTPNTALRLIAYSIILFLQEAHIVGFILSDSRNGQRRLGAPLAVTIAALALTNLIRIVGVMHLGAPSNYLQAGDFLAWIVMVNSVLQCGALVAYVWMTAAILRGDLETQAATDPLTGLLNRRAIEAAADRHILRCAQANTPLSAIVIDLDRFKEINDAFGHHRGDETLIAVASTLAANIRTTDLLARMGGDEFAIVLPSTSLENAHRIAEKLRHALATLQIGSPRPNQITASFGVAPAKPNTKDWDHLSMECDKALYAAKDQGGNTLTTRYAEPLTALSN